MLTRSDWFRFFILRPYLYPEFWRRGKALLGKTFSEESTKEKSRAQATEWCAARSVNTVEAIAAITGSTTINSVEKQFFQVITAAHAEQDRCPATMGGAANLDLLFNLSEYLQAQSVVETGVAYGWSSLAILLSLQHRPAARLISVDMPYPGRNNDRYVGCVVPTNLRAQWTLIRRADRQGLPKAVRTLGQFDMCHYDSDKSYAGRMWAYPLLWEHLRPGGILISDDISDNVAFLDFCEHLKINPLIVEMASTQRGKKYVGLLRKAT